MAELDARLLEEPLPTDTVDPVTHPLITACARRVGFQDLFDGCNGARPPGRFLGNEGNRQLGEHGGIDDIGNLAAHPQGNAVTILVGQRQRRTHGVAVAAEHTATVVDFHTLHVIDLLGLDGIRGARCNDEGNFADILHALMLNEWRLAVHAKNGDVGAMHGTAHVQAACQCDTHLGGQLVGAEVFIQLVHDRLYRTRGIDGGSVAVRPPLRVHDIGHGVARSTDGEPVSTAPEVIDERLKLGFVAHQEFDVVAGGPAKMAAAILVGDVAHFTDEISADEPSRAHAHRVNLRTRFGNMHQNSRLQNLMIFPLAEVFLDDWRKEPVELRGTDVCDAVLHWIFGIISH